MNRFKIPESHKFEDIQLQSMTNLIWLDTVDSEKIYTTTLHQRTNLQAIIIVLYMPYIS